MSIEQRMIRIYDRAMRSNNQRRAYGGSGFFNFGYWRRGARTQKEASEALVDRLVERVADRNGRVLDVACGIGGSTERLLRIWPATSIVAINISANQLEAAAKRAPGCTFERMDATRLAFPDASFRTVVCVEAAFHFDTREAFLKEALRVLEPGGTLVMSDILFRGPRALVREFAWVPPANRLPSADAYRALLARTGFEAIDVESDREGCFGGHRRALTSWPIEEWRAGRFKFMRMVGALAASSTLSSAFQLGVRDYLLVTARKPGSASRPAA